VKGMLHIDLRLKSFREHICPQMKPSSFFENLMDIMFSWENDPIEMN
jgi:hypothetical protein